MLELAKAITVKKHLGPWEPFLIWRSHSETQFPFRIGEIILDYEANEMIRILDLYSFGDESIVSNPLFTSILQLVPVHDGILVLSIAHS